VIPKTKKTTKAKSKKPSETKTKSQQKPKAKSQVGMQMGDVSYKMQQIAHKSIFYVALSVYRGFVRSISFSTCRRSH
jgi:hypothetical protein